MTIRISQIAKQCGVSTATVSRVLNHSEKVTQSTQIKVMKAIEEMNYSPNQSARNLRTQSTKMIGIIIPHNAEYIFNYPYFSIFLRELARSLSSNHYFPIITTEKSDGGELDTYRMFIERKIVDAFILLDIQDEDPRISFLKTQKAKFLVIGRPKNFEDLLYVDTDNEMGSYLATTHLLQKGYRRILFINGPPTQSVCTWRKQGFVRAYEEMGVSLYPELMKQGDFQEKSGFDIVKSCMEPFDAIFAVSDLMAMGTIQALRERKHSCAVIGFDNIPLSATFNPSLSTVNQPIDQVGSIAGQEIIRLVEQNQAKSTVLHLSLVLRESTEAFHNRA